MSFVSFSVQHSADTNTSVSNVFLDEHLPTANGDCVRVYLYGLYLCGTDAKYHNSIEHFSQALNMTEDDIMSAFAYWQDLGLVQVLSVRPVQVKYLPVQRGSHRMKKIVDNKYSDFNIQIQSIIDGRMITPFEYSEYHTFMESMHVEPEALLMVAKYCADLKKSNIGYAYILKVAKTWAYQGIKTVAQVEEKFAVQEYDTTTIAKILKNLGSKRNAEPGDYDLLHTWRLKGFDDETLCTVAVFCHKSGRKKIEDMDEVIEKFFKLGLTSPDSINNYVSGIIAKDKIIKKLLTDLGLERDVANIDRDFYNTWTTEWNFTADIISYASTLSLGMASPMAYMNKVLSSWRDKGIKSLSKAKTANYTAPTVNITRHSYSEKDLKSLFANIEEVKF